MDGPGIESINILDSSFKIYQTVSTTPSIHQLKHYSLSNFHERHSKPLQLHLLFPYPLVPIACAFAAFRPITFHPVPYTKNTQKMGLPSRPSRSRSLSSCSSLPFLASPSHRQKASLSRVLRKRNEVSTIALLLLTLVSLNHLLMVDGGGITCFCLR